MNTYGKQQWRRGGTARYWRRSLAPAMVLLSAAAAALCLCPPAAVWAQAQQQQQQTSPQAQTSPPNQIPAQTPPDAQIIVMPDPVSAQWAVATVYPKKVPRAEAEARQKQLLALTGWKAGKVEFEDRALERVDNPKGLEKPPVMSSLTFQTASPVVDWSDGTLTVEPFARAFRDLDRIHVTYLLPPGFRFRGLTNYRDDNIDVAFSGSQNAYTYVLAIKNHELGELKLPRYGTDAAASRAAGAPGSKGAGGGASLLRRGLGIFLVVLAAIAAGLTAYLIISRPRGGSRRGA